MLDPLRPYADLIRLALWIGLALAIAGAGFYGGLRWSAEELETEKARVADLNRALSDFVSLFEEVNAQHKREAAEAARREQRADELVADAVSRTEKYRHALGKVTAEIEEAKRDPTCRALLEQQACALLR